MKRLLLNQIVRQHARGLTARADVLWRISITFPFRAFADAPVWAPGPGWYETIPGYAWIRPEPEGGWSVLAGSVLSSEGVPSVLTAWTDAPWQAWEAWNKPKRLVREEGARIEPYERHPLATVHAYWDGFETEHGFHPVPQREPLLDPLSQTVPAPWVSAPDRPWQIVLTCNKNWDDPYRIARAVQAVVRRWNARWQMHPHEEEVPVGPWGWATATGILRARS